MLKDYYKKYIETGHNDKGILNKFKINCPDDFNFAYDIIDKYAELEPNARALVWVNPKGDERTFTFSELSRYSIKAANLFASKGVKYGDTVKLVLKGHYQFWLAMLGLERLGAVTVPATHMLTAKDYVYRFEQAEIKHIIITGSDSAVAQNVDNADEELGGVLVNKFIVGGVKFENWIDFDTELERQPDTMTRVKTNVYDMLLLYFTSGTTGYPKMVTHNHRYALAHTQTAMWLNNRYDGLHLTIADTGWAKAMWGKMYGQFLLGCAIFVYDYDRFNPVEMLSVVSKYKVTSFCAPPTMYRFFIQEDVKSFDLSALEYCCTAGEALNPEVFERWLEFTGHKMMEGFGQTESVIIVATMPGMMPKPGSMGKPLPLYDVDIYDENGKPAAAGEVGEICLRSERGNRESGLFNGYHKNDELTDSVWYDGLYHTGDTAWKDEDGYFWYVGRNDDMIKSSGYRIGPFEVESVLMTHPLVLECAITGAPDPVRGQVVKATVVLVKGAAGSPELVKELQKHVTENTAPYKYPRIIEFVEELPKTISGKIRRVQIRKEDNK
ncbi:MAG: AMP-binding protein [Oscillospiraceae bacterium]|jgi:acetyl-CoA synthetase|nr:AMP-binding protein [Oscillospiraceae bacterium]